MIHTVHKDNFIGLLILGSYLKITFLPTRDVKAKERERETETDISNMIHTVQKDNLIGLLILGSYLEITLILKREKRETEREKHRQTDRQQDSNKTITNCILFMSSVCS